MNKMKNTYSALAMFTAELVGFAVLLYVLRRITEQGLANETSMISGGQLTAVLVGTLLVMATLVSVGISRAKTTKEQQNKNDRLAALAILLALLSQFVYIFTFPAVAVGVLAIGKQPRINRADLALIVVAILASLGSVVSAFSTAS